MITTFIIIFAIGLYFYFSYKNFVEEQNAFKAQLLKEKEAIEIENQVYSKSKLMVLPDGYDVD